MCVSWEIQGGLPGLESAPASQWREGRSDIVARCQVECRHFGVGKDNFYRVAEHQVGRLAGHTQEVCGLGKLPPV